MRFQLPAAWRHVVARAAALGRRREGGRFQRRLSVARAEVYAKWYGEKHNDPGRLAEAVYGLPELFRSDIMKAKLIANPGCYPTARFWPGAALEGRRDRDGRHRHRFQERCVRRGANAEAEDRCSPSATKACAAYGVGKHRHTPEIEQVLSTACGQPLEVIFTPHLIPMDRGILTTAYSRPKPGVTEEQMLETLREFYAASRLSASSTFAGHERHDRHQLLRRHGRLVRGRVITISVLDNLIKGPPVRPCRTSI